MYDDNVRDGRDRFRPMSMSVEDSMTVDLSSHPEHHDCYCQHYLIGGGTDLLRLLANNPSCVIQIKII